MLQFLPMLAYALTAAAAAKSLATKPPENKIDRTANPQGGIQPQAQDLFQQGQPTSTPSLPAPVQAPQSADAFGTIGSLLSMMPQSMPPSGSGAGPQPGMGIMPIQGQAPQPGMGIMPMAGQGPPPTAPSAPIDWNKILSMSGSAADALAKAAPLLGLTDQPQRHRMIAGAAGGGGGQNVFQMPQRMTLAQILASLPRTM